MTTPQRKAGSAFGYDGTAEEVLRGIDLSGRLALVTGGCSGIGLETTRALSRAGAHVVVPARRREPAHDAVQDLAGVEVDELDLADLDTVGREHDVRAFSVHPGSILTPLHRHLSKDEMIAAGWIDDDGNLADPIFKTPQQGAATQVWAATSPQLEGLGGVYCEDCDVAEPGPADGAETGVSSHATDPDEAARLWDLSTSLTQTDTPTTG